MTTTAIKSKLTPEEAERLAVLEQIVTTGITMFTFVGEALLEISDSRLYRETHSTFKDYVGDKWKMTAARAYQLCEAAEVVKALPGKMSTMVDNERQARELSKAAPEQREAVLQEAASDGPVTAKAIKKAVQRRESPAPPVEDEPEKPQVEAGVPTQEPPESIGGLNVVHYFALRVEEIVDEAIAAKASAPQLRALSLACQAGARRATAAAKEVQ